MRDTEVPESTEIKTLDAIGRFIGRYGLSTAIALVFVWWVLQERSEGYKATALQIKDLNGQLMHVSGLLVEHDKAAQQNAIEVSRILMAQCINTATEREQRERCLGWR